MFEIALPPLRERAEDILELADSSSPRSARASAARPRASRPTPRSSCSPTRWPGNVRELRNAIERAVILADGGLIRSQHLPVSGAGRAPAPAALTGALPPGGVDLGEIERSLVVNALTRARHNKTRAAKLLGLTRAQLYLADRKVRAPRSGASQ